MGRRKDSAIPFSPESICLNVNGCMPIPLHVCIRIPLPNAMSPFALQITINLFTLIPLLTRAAVSLAFPPLWLPQLLGLSSIFSFPSWQVRQTAGETAVRDKTKTWGPDEGVHTPGWMKALSCPSLRQQPRKGIEIIICVQVKGQYTKHSWASCRNQIMLPEARASLEQYN